MVEQPKYLIHRDLKDTHFWEWLCSCQMNARGSNLLNGPSSSTLTLADENTKTLTLLRRTYGPIIYIRAGWRRIVVVNSPYVAREMLDKRYTLATLLNFTLGALLSIEDPKYIPHGHDLCQGRSSREICVVSYFRTEII